MLYVISTLSYDASLLPHFFRYYRNLGITSFIISLHELVPGIIEEAQRIASRFECEVRWVPVPGFKSVHYQPFDCVQATADNVDAMMGIFVALLFPDQILCFGPPDGEAIGFRCGANETQGIQSSGGHTDLHIYDRESRHITVDYVTGSSSTGVYSYRDNHPKRRVSPSKSRASAESLIDEKYLISKVTS
jgi:hypothetical protein